MLLIFITLKECRFLYDYDFITKDSTNLKRYFSNNNPYIFQKGFKLYDQMCVYLFGPLL